MRTVTRVFRNLSSRLRIAKPPLTGPAKWLAGLGRVCDCWCHACVTWT